MLQEFAQQMMDNMAHALDNVHTSAPGRIVKFDPATCRATVDVELQFKKPDGSQVKYPPIANVPVRFFQTNNQESTIASPIREGDGCEVHFSEQALEAWKSGGENNPDLKHDLTNAIAVVGLSREPNETMMEACNEDAIIIRHRGAKIKIQDGTITVTGANVSIDGNLQVNGNISATGSVMDGGGNTNHHSH